MGKSSDTDFQLPLSQLTYWRHHTEHQTPLGELGVELGFVRPHVHNWRFVAGGGNGIVCALGGAGRDIDRAARSESYFLSFS
jgi:hypothetical protein